MNEELKLIEDIIDFYFTREKAIRRNTDDFNLDNFMGFMLTSSPKNIYTDIEKEIHYDIEVKKLSDILEDESINRMANRSGLIDQSLFKKYVDGERTPELGTCLLIAADLRLPWKNEKNLCVEELLKICSLSFYENKPILQVLKNIYTSLWNRDRNDFNAEILSEIFDNYLKEAIKDHPEYEDIFDFSKSELIKQVKSSI